MQTARETQHEICTFIAIWDEAYGPKVVDFYPKPSFDIDSLAVNMFMTFETVFGSDTSTQFERTTMVMPLKALDLNAKIYFETVPNPEVRSGKQPFIVTTLVPEALNDESLKSFDKVLERIAAAYAKNQQPLLESYHEEIQTIYRGEIGGEEVESIDDNYSYTAAIEDFKEGVKLFKARKENAYAFLKKALLKFRQENNTKLEMEATFLVASVLAQRGKMEAAKKYFANLEALATSLGDEKYHEKSIFMEGFCEYKLDNFLDALSHFNRIEGDKTTNINPLQYFNLKGRVERKLEFFNEAVKSYGRALELSQTGGAQPKLLKMRSQILYERGLAHYQGALNSLRKKGIESKKSLETEIDNAIDHFIASVEIFEELGDSKSQVPVLKLVANIYGLREDKKRQLEYYQKAFKCAEMANDLPEKVKILDRIVQIQEKEGLYQEKITQLTEFLDSLSHNVFIDQATLARYYKELGESYQALNRPDDAVAQYLLASTTYRKFEFPLEGELQVLDHLSQIFEDKGNQERAKYYKDILAEKTQKMRELKPPAPPKTSVLGNLRELWIYAASGIELYDYSPETKLDPDLLGGFLTAIQSFSLELHKEEIQALVIGSDRYTFYREADQSYYLLGRSSLTVPEDTVQKTMRRINQKFAREFEGMLEGDVVDTEPFHKFTQILENVDFTMT